MTHNETELDDIQHEIIWLIQHGHEDKPFSVVEAEIKELAKAEHELTLLVDKERQ